MTSPSSYDPVFFAPLFAVEDRHFWFRMRNQAIDAVVRQVAAGLAPGHRVLEVGCGTGNVLRVLEQACPGGTVVGMDLFVEGLRFARRRTRCPLVQGDLEKPPFEPRFDVVGLFDVLEHLPDDLGVLDQVHRLLAPGGTLLLTVPACPGLWSYFDEASHHYRRYEESDLRSKLTRTGFQVDYLTPYMAAIFPLVWIGRRLAGFRDRRPAGNHERTRDLAVQELQTGPIMNRLLARVLAPELLLIQRRVRLPVGTSLLAVAHRT